MKRVILLGSVIYLLLVLALASTNGTLLALMLPFLVYLGIGFFFNPEKTEFAATRQISRERVYPGEVVEIRLTVTNQGSGVELAQIEDLIPEGLEIVEGTHQLLTQIHPGEIIELNYTVSGSRGFYHFGDVQITTSDTLQVRSKVSRVEAAGRLFIQPAQLRMGRLDIRPRRTRVYAGHIPARRGGPGVEFFGVREYQQGDPLRLINWRASARQHQAFFINQFEQERVADVGVILDTRQRSEIIAESGASLFEHGVAAAAALAETFLADGNRVGLLLYGTLVDWTLPDYGKIQRERILQRLATATPGESLIFGELDSLPTRLLPQKSQIVFVSPLQAGDLKVLTGLRARGYSVMVVSPNPIAFELKHLPSTDANTVTAARLAGLERVLMIKQLQQAGVQVLDWHIDTPLDQAVKVALNRPVPILCAPG